MSGLHTIAIHEGPSSATRRLGRPSGTRILKYFHDPFAALRPCAGVPFGRFVVSGAGSAPPGTVIEFCTDEESPSSSVTVSTTVYARGLGNVWVGSVSADVAPSPKFHSRAAIAPSSDERS